MCILACCPLAMPDASVDASIRQAFVGEQLQYKQCHAVDIAGVSCSVLPLVTSAATVISERSRRTTSGRGYRGVFAACAGLTVAALVAIAAVNQTARRDSALTTRQGAVPPPERPPTRTGPLTVSVSRIGSAAQGTSPRRSSASSRGQAKE
jgi:hypothetical protein